MSVNPSKLTDRTNWTLKKILPWLMVIGGLIAVAASFALTIEKLDLLMNPHYTPACDLNPILSCSSVTKTHQAEAFGFPNPFIGLAGYAAVATIGAVLLAGATLKRWFWRATEAGLLLAIAFVTWLQFETLYRIGSLCIYCMVVWAVTIPIFWYTTLYNLREGHLSLPKRFKTAAVFADRHHADILVLWFLIILLLILKRFWYYWSSLI